MKRNAKAKVKKVDSDEEHEGVRDFTQTYTLTFGDRAENHKGMQMIGREVESGLSHEDLTRIQKYFAELGYDTELINLNELLELDEKNSSEAGTEISKDSTESDSSSDSTEESEDEPVEDNAELLVIRNGLSAFVDVDKLFDEQSALKKDENAFMYGRVVNKKARHNLCFSDFSQKPDYAKGKGTVYNFKDLPLLKRLRAKIGGLNPLLKKLQCEGNYYYDVKKTFIGFHGDTERMLVVGCRLGADFPLFYQWYYKSNPVGRLYKIVLSHGDIYFMSDKAVGRDWKKSSIHTLRHAAGFENSLGIK